MRSWCPSHEPRHEPQGLFFFFFKPRDAAQACESLKRLAKNLRDIQAKPDVFFLNLQPNPGMDDDLANWFADAVDDYTLKDPTRRTPRAVDGCCVGF